MTSVIALVNDTSTSCWPQHFCFWSEGTQLLEVAGAPTVLACKLSVVSSFVCVCVGGGRGGGLAPPQCPITSFPEPDG